MENVQDFFKTADKTTEKKGTKRKIKRLPLLCLHTYIDLYTILLHSNWNIIDPFDPHVCTYNIDIINMVTKIRIWMIIVKLSKYYYLVKYFYTVQITAVYNGTRFGD